MNTGKALRMRRIFDDATGTTVMFAFSHGTSSPTVIDGLEDPAQKIESVRAGGADCVFLAPGLMESEVGILASSSAMAVVAKISATASRGGALHQERQIASVAHCAALGADGVVAMIPFAPDNEPDVITLMAGLGEECSKLGIPLIAEAEFPNAYYGEGDYAKEWGLPYLKRSARLCAELGADVVKSNWPGSPDGFAEIVASVSVPVVVAGGSRESDAALLERLHSAMSAGAAGCSVGRNIFQHESPTRITSAIRAVVRGEMTPSESMDAHLSGIRAG
jgi:fructose-bisphosphate aldolase / 2-amino-3,7-dideoxy-D-threo-hept-6-ulosonate synthase